MIYIKHLCNSDLYYVTRDTCMYESFFKATLAYQRDLHKLSIWTVLQNVIT